MQCSDVSKIKLKDNIIMDAIEALKTRRSIRKYKNTKIDKSILEDIVECGRRSATAMNTQPWEFVIVTDADILENIAKSMNHSHFVGKSAASVFVFCKDYDYYLEDGSAALMNIMNAIHAYGLSGCWVAGEKQEFAKPISEILGAPDHQKLVGIATVGYADEEPEIQEKRSLAEVLHWEKFK